MHNLRKLVKNDWVRNPNDNMDVCYDYNFFYILPHF